MTKPRTYLNKKKTIKVRTLTAINACIDILLNDMTGNAEQPLCDMYFTTSSCNYCPLSNGSYKGCTDAITYITRNVNIRNLDKCDIRLKETMTQVLIQSNTKRLVYYTEVKKIIEATPHMYMNTSNKYKYPLIKELNDVWDFQKEV